MSINKSYVLAGAAIAATSIVSMTNISTVEAASQIATVTENVNFRTIDKLFFNNCNFKGKFYWSFKYKWELGKCKI